MYWPNPGLLKKSWQHKDALSTKHTKSKQVQDDEIKSALWTVIWKRTVKVTQNTESNVDSSNNC